ncbi:hypothetical protein ACEWY4_006293 [Coilia grayii]|uniref:Lysyl oxidase homolog n=1 Tax=Coilia grayii TaxID=363190 RepID=A0ABD1KDE8_9TELE
MAKFATLPLCVLCALIHFIIAQQQSPRDRPGQWRQRIQWQNNGQVYSLFSTGSEYQTPVQSRAQSRVFLSSRTDGGRRAQVTTGTSSAGRQTREQANYVSSPGANVLGRESRQNMLAANSRVPGARIQTGASQRQTLTGSPGARRYVPEYTYRTNFSTHGTLPEFSGSGVPRRGGNVAVEDNSARGTSHSAVVDNQENAFLPAESVPLALEDSNSLSNSDSGPQTLPSQSIAAGGPEPIANREHAPVDETAVTDDMVNDDPRNPLKNHRNNIFYNPYPSRTAPRVRRPPGTGYGTRYFHNGLPDLVPDPYSIQAGTYIQRMQMYALRCAAEENCLSRSAYRPGVRDIDYRVLLRFPQRVRNRGTADFLPVKPRHQWEWHSCHQHYHSMDAFSNYDLLDMLGRKVAEGHKASFCLEDTGCDPGFRRRFACTTHTQGLSPGCYDTYAANIDCQWIDITDVPPGTYILKVTVNPNFLVQESDFSNNVVRCDMIYSGSHVQTRNCRITR